MKKAVIITVRSDSSRLPGKAYKTILGTPIIEMVIKRAKLVKSADMVIVCTTKRKIDDKIIKIAKKQEVNYFRGSLEDKLERWNGAIDEFNIECFATFDGDDLLCAPELIDLAFEQIEKNNLDYIKSPEGLVCGAFTYCIKSSSLKKVCQIKNSTDTEMMWTYFEDTNIFRIGSLKVQDKAYFSPKARLTLDYPEDFEFFNTIFKHFDNVSNDVSLLEVMGYLKMHPEIVAINEERAKEWKQNQINKTNLVLK